MLASTYFGAYGSSQHTTTLIWFVNSHNNTADHLSRNNMHLFFSTNPGASLRPIPLPHEPPSITAVSNLIGRPQFSELPFQNCLNKVDNINIVVHYSLHTL